MPINEYLRNKPLQIFASSPQANANLDPRPGDPQLRLPRRLRRALWLEWRREDDAREPELPDPSGRCRRASVAGLRAAALLGQRGGLQAHEHRAIVCYWL